jgi:hypothetical protein
MILEREFLLKVSWWRIDIARSDYGEDEVRDVATERGSTYYPGWVSTARAPPYIYHGTLMGHLQVKNY